MRIIAYIYSDPLLESPPSSDIWGWEVDRVYQDVGSDLQMRELLAVCQQEQIDYLLIRRLEELGNDINIISDRLNHLESLGVNVVTIEQDYNSHSWKKSDRENLKSNLSKLLCQIQENTRRSKLKRGHARNRLKILPPPGKAPYGYRRGKDKYIIDKSTAPVVKDFFERFILFGSLRGAVRYLEKRYGKKISPSTGRNWLINPVYRGNLKYQKTELIANTHAPIINRQEAAQIDRLLRRNSRLATRTASAPRSLAGLVICQKCQLTLNISRVTQHQKKSEYLYLRCHKCPQKPKCKALAYDLVLKQTINKICIDLNVAAAQVNLPNNYLIENTLKQKIKQNEEIIKQLPKLLEQEILDRETLDLRNYKLRAEIAQLENKIAQLPPGNLQAIAKTVSLPQFWLDLSEEERRFYFREFIKQIEIIRNESSSWDLQIIFIF